MMRFLFFVCGIVSAVMPVVVCAQVESEQWAKDLPSVAEAVAHYAPRRIGILMVALDEKVDPGMRYEKIAPIQYTRTDKGMPEWYVVRFYDELRQAFEGRGYRVTCVNRQPWQGLRLREVVAQAQGVDAVCVVHYTTTYTHKAGTWDASGWWTPFKGMHLVFRCGIYDVKSGAMIYALEGKSVGTQMLYGALADLVAEEPMYPSGYDRHGRPNRYQIAIYNTDFKDPREGKRTIPLIRTAKDALDISFVPDSGAGQGVRIYDPTTGAEIMQGAGDLSVLDRLLNHVTYRTEQAEIVYFDLLGLVQCVDLVVQKIPRR